jgi:hypothetical protein
VTVEFLIQAGANPNATDSSGVAPLQRAVRTRCTAAVRVLLVNGADLHMRNKRGSTPLHLAVQNSGRGGTGTAAAREAQQEIIRVLRSHGVRPADKNAAGRSVQACVTANRVRALLS